MKRKILSVMIRALNNVTDLRFVLGVLTGAGFIAIVMGHGLGMF